MNGVAVRRRRLRRRREGRVGRRPYAMRAGAAFVRGIPRCPRRTRKGGEHSSTALPCNDVSLNLVLCAADSSARTAIVPLLPSVRWAATSASATRARGDASGVRSSTRNAAAKAQVSVGSSTQHSAQHGKQPRSRSHHSPHSVPPFSRAKRAEDSVLVVQQQMAEWRNRPP